MGKIGRFSVSILTILLLALFPAIVPVGPTVEPVQAATVSESGGTMCTQTVSNSSSVTVTKITDAGTPFCVVQFARVGTTDWTVPTGVTSVRYLIVAGGGGGGGRHGGGGGAGGALTGNSLTTPSAVLSFVVGDGGAGSTRLEGQNSVGQPAAKGQDSSALGFTAKGGGAGYGKRNATNSEDHSGGSGGGSDFAALDPGLGTTGQGNPGGRGTGATGIFYTGGGGGGAGNAGGAGNSATQVAGNGGDGTASSITGTSLIYAAGGGGGTYVGATAGEGGSNGIGGAGGAGAAGGSGLDGRGGGGGGGGQTDDVWAFAGGDGGSGTVIVRYSLSPLAPTISVSGGAGQASITWSAPSYTGGLSITDYVVEYKPSGGSWTTFADGVSASTGATVTGLTNGTSYTFRVSSVNASGTGEPSAESAAVIPRASQTVSWSPTNNTVALSDGSSVTLSPSASSSGGTTIAYSVASSGSPSPSCSISNSANPTVTFSAVGTCVIRATAAQAGAYLSATADITLTVGYKVTYLSNDSQHQRGVAGGAVPSTSYHAAGSTVTVSANSGTLTRQGFSLGGWNTQSNAGGTTYGLGTGTFTISADTDLYAKWEIPKSARLIGLTGADAVSVVTATGEPVGSTYAMRGLTNDGSSLYFAPTSPNNVIRELDFSGAHIADHVVTGFSAPEQRALAYSSGCIFYRGVAGVVVGGSDLWCIDTSTWTRHAIAVPASYPLESGGGWLVGNLIDFPDGRIGAMTAPSSTVGQVSPCPADMYCKRLRLYTPSGTGSGVTLTFSEDIILADTVGAWPSDDHGISTDGTYLYQIHHQAGYKVWALRSGAPSYLVFNADGSGTCAADTGVSGSLCVITQGLRNATFITRDHTAKRYLVGDYGTNLSGSNKFYVTTTAEPPAGPGTPAVPGSPTGVSAEAGASQATVSWTAPASSGGAPITGYTVTASPGSATCTTSTTSCVVTGLTIGTAYTFTVVATNLGGDSEPSTASSSVTPQKLSQTLTFASISDQVYGTSPFSVSVSTDSGLTISLSSDDTSVCTVSGTTVTIVSVGTCELEATQSGNGTYLAATAVTRSFSVTAKPITMSVTISDKTYDGLSSATLSGTPTLTGVLAGDSTYVAVDTAKIVAQFGSPSVDQNKTVTVTLQSGVLKAGASGDRSARYSVTVSGTPTADIDKANQGTLSMTSASSMIFGQTIPLVAVGGSSSGALSYSHISGPCSVTGAEVSATGTGSCVVRATRAADANYNEVNSSNFTITVSAANQTLAFTSSVPVSAVAGTTYTPAATATSGLNPTFSITTGDGTVCSISLGVVTFAQSGTCVITATQSGNSNYNAATPVTQTIVAGKINQTITFPSIATKDFSDPSFSGGATVSSGRSVTYQTSTSAVCSVGAATGVITIKTVGDCTITASSAGDASYAAASDVTRTFRIDPVTPGKPSITSVSFGNSSVTVAFTAPSYVGGDAIDGYQLIATSSSGSVTKPDCGTSSPCTISGLVNGESYTLTISAVNAAGVGSASDQSPAVTPATIPDAVSALTTTPGDQQLQVDWSKATSFGGGTFTRYDVYLRVRGNSWGTPVAIGNVNTETYTFTGLTNGTAYDVKVVTVSSANGSELSSNTATALGVPSTTPGAPTGLSVTALTNTTAVASWTAPLDDGGAVITAYSVTPSCVFVNPTDAVCDFSGLVAGSTLTVTVGASNLMGTGTTVTVSITMPGGSSGGGGGGSGATSNSQAATVQNTPIVTPRRIIGPIQQPQQNAPAFRGPVVDPGRGFDPNAGIRAIIGGQPATVNRSQDPAGNLSIQTGTVDLGIRVPSGNSGNASSGANGSASPPELTVPRGQAAEFKGSGLLPGSQLQIWLPGTGQTPRELARIPVNPDGSFSSQLSFSARQLETPLPIGRQVMQVTGYDQNGNATVVDMPVNIAQGAPAPEPNRAVNALPSLVPGESLATSGGIPESVSISFQPDQGQVQIESGQWAFQVVLPEGNGQVSETGVGGFVTLIQSKTASVQGNGFQPDSRVDIWLFSDPTLLGTVLVGADGSFSTEVFVDQRYVVVGEHTLQLQGVGEDGLIKAANLGVTVAEEAELTSDSAGQLLLWIAGGAGLLAVLVIGIALSRRRRARV